MGYRHPFNLNSYLKPVHKSVSEPWVRVASSAQSRGGATSLLNESQAETARWKRRVPRLA